jgi:hypothetical protein
MASASQAALGHAAQATQLEISRQYLDEYPYWAEEHPVELALLNGLGKDVKPCGRHLAQPKRDHGQAIEQCHLASPPAGQFVEVVEQDQDGEQIATRDD